MFSTSATNVNRNGNGTQARLSSEICASIISHAANNGGHEHIAALMGLNYSTWYNSLHRNANPMQDDLARLALYMKSTGNLEPLRLIADFCNHFIEPKPDFDNDGHDLRHDALVLNKEAGDFGAELDDLATDGLDEKKKKYLRRKVQRVKDHAGKIDAKIGGGER